MLCQFCVSKERLEAFQLVQTDSPFCSHLWLDLWFIIILSCWYPRGIYAPRIILEKSCCVFFRGRCVSVFIKWPPRVLWSVGKTYLRHPEVLLQICKKKGFYGVVAQMLDMVHRTWNKEKFSDLWCVLSSRQQAHRSRIISKKSRNPSMQPVMRTVSPRGVCIQGVLSYAYGSTVWIRYSPNSGPEQRTWLQRREPNTQAETPPQRKAQCAHLSPFLGVPAKAPDGAIEDESCCRTASRSFAAMNRRVLFRPARVSASVPKYPYKRTCVYSLQWESVFTDFSCLSIVGIFVNALSCIVRGHIWPFFVFVNILLNSPYSVSRSRLRVPSFWNASFSTE